MPLVATPARLADAHWRRLDLIRGRLLAGLMVQWRQRGFDDPPVDESVQQVLAGQRAAVAATDAYLAVAAGVVRGGGFDPIGLDPAPLIGSRARRGVRLEHVYNRVAKVGREDGFARGVEFLRQSITTDVALAQRNAAFVAQSVDDGVAGWRRVTNPFGGRVCGMCVAAASRTYSRGDLQPIHRMCRCTTAPIYDSAFVGRTLDRERLDAAYELAGGTDYVALSRVRFSEADLPAGVDSGALDALNVRVVDDRELGPMLEADRHDVHFSI